MKKITKHRHHNSSLTIKKARQLRQYQTPAESILWRALRNRNIGYKFRRQFPIDRFIVDFYCPQVKLCIEIDGGTHYEARQAAYDAARTTFLERHSYKVIRFTNDDVRLNINAVIDEIVREIENLVSLR